MQGHSKCHLVPAVFMARILCHARSYHLSVQITLHHSSYFILPSLLQVIMLLCSLASYLSTLFTSSPYYPWHLHTQPLPGPLVFPQIVSGIYPNTNLCCFEVAALGGAIVLTVSLHCEVGEEVKGEIEPVSCLGARMHSGVRWGVAD